MSQSRIQPGSEEGRSSSPEGFKVWRPGHVAYRDALSFQERMVAARPDWPFDLLILLQHPAVITFGRRTDKLNLLASPATLLNAGIDCVETGRGGDITLHNPGQLVGYPIIDLNYYRRDLHRYLRLLEEVLIATLADFGLDADTIPGKTGVWIANRKIASIGVAVRRWISYHGFALNVCNDLSAFNQIVPCGLPDVTMTSMTAELGQDLDTEQVSEVLIRHFSKIMQRPLLGNFDEDETSSQTRLA